MVATHSVYREVDPLGDGPMLQGALIDQTSGDVFIARDDQGDTVIDRYDGAGHVESMRFIAAGHGSTFGIQRVGTVLYVWLSRKGVVTRAPWTAATGTILAETYPLKGWPVITRDLLGVHSTTAGVETVTVFNVADVVAGYTDGPIGKVAIPADAAAEIFQGFTVDEKHAWYLTGPTIGRAGALAGEKIMLRKFDHQTGALLETRDITHLGLQPGEPADLNHEPEMLQSLLRSDGTLLLLAGAKVGTGTKRRMRIVTVDTTPPPVKEAEPVAAYSPKAIKGIFNFVRDHYPGVKLGGIYANKSGYHNSRNNLKAAAKWRNDYSITQAPADLEGDGDAASAIDLTPDTQELQRLFTRRLMAATKADDDPRAYPIREFFGTENGQTVTGWSRWRGKEATSDSSHLWHVHISIYRKFANDEAAMRGIAEIVCGIPLKPIDTKSDPTEEEIMAVADDVARKVLTLDGVIDNVFTGNPANKEVSLETALVYTFKKLEAVEAKLDRLLAVKK